MRDIDIEKSEYLKKSLVRKTKTSNTRDTEKMMGTMSMRQPENWLYEIWQKGQDSPCYVMVPNAKVSGFFTRKKFQVIS